MNLKNQFKLLVLGYYGVLCLDEYDLKVYILKDIENYIRTFIEINSINDFDYKSEALNYEKEASKKTKLQDALIVLNKIKAPMEVVLAHKEAIEKIKTLTMADINEIKKIIKDNDED